MAVPGLEEADWYVQLWVVWPVCQEPQAGWILESLTRVRNGHVGTFVGAVSMGSVLSGNTRNCTCPGFTLLSPPRLESKIVVDSVDVLYGTKAYV